jgi:PAS domain S-box-containing protein
LAIGSPSISPNALVQTGDKNPRMNRYDRARRGSRQARAMHTGWWPGMLSGTFSRIGSAVAVQPGQPWRLRGTTFFLVAVVSPLLLFALQWFVWPDLRPYAWMLFAFLTAATAWLGGTWSGIFGTLLSTALIWWAFVPPERSFRLDEPRYALAIGIFAVLGATLSTFQGRLRRATEALRASEAKYSGLVAIASDAIVSVEPGAPQRIVIFNRGAEQIFGWTASEALGQPLELLIPERYRAAHRRHITAFATGGSTARNMGERIDVWGVRKNGEEFPAQAAISRLELGDARLLTIVLRDVTRQRRDEDEHKFLAEVGAALASTLDYEETLTRVAELAVRKLADFCAVDVVDDGGTVSRLRVVSRDPSKESICDLIRQIPLDRSRPLVIWSVLESSRPAVLHGLTPEMRAAFASDPTCRETFRAVDAQAVLSVPLLAHGKLLGTMTFLSSTPSREYGPDDVRFAEEIARHAALAIDHARLYREARRAVEARDDVLGIVAHDLRNPVTSILIQSQLLVRQGAEPEGGAGKPAAAIHRSALRMNRLINDLLDVARIEAGRLSIEPSRVSASDLLSESVEAQRALADQTSLDLRLDAERALPEVWADRERLLQVFENLIGNAAKFTGPGGRVTVGASAGQGEDVFWVSDTGPGVSAEDTPHLFDRFWQARRTGRHGAGLGLPIVKGIVEAHGGRVWVETESGRGTTVAFTIPTVSGAGPRRDEAAAER